MEVPVVLPGGSEAAAPALNPRLFPQMEVVVSSLWSRELCRLFNLSARSTFIPSPHGCSRSETCQRPRRKLTDGAALPPSRLPAPCSSPSITRSHAKLLLLFIFFVLSGHLQIWFCPFSPPRLSGPLPETTKGGKEEELCDPFRTSSPGGRCVGRGAEG